MWGKWAAILWVACGPILIFALVLRAAGHRRAHHEARKLFRTLEGRRQ